MKKRLKIKTFHPYEEYTATSEVLDLAIIELVEGFSLSQKVATNIWDRMGLRNTEFSMHSMSIYLLSNHLENGMNFAMTFSQISDRRICATILPIDPPENPKGMYDPQDSDSNTKDFMFGYTVEALDITREETCILGLKVREMKDDIKNQTLKNIICSVPKPPQKVMEKVRMCLCIDHCPGQFSLNKIIKIFKTEFF